MSTTTPAGVSTTTYPYSGGYQCSNCKTWVFPNTIHQCTWTIPAASPSPLPTYVYYTINPVELEELKQEIRELKELVKDIIAQQQ